MKKIFVLAIVTSMLYACGGSTGGNNTSSTDTNNANNAGSATSDTNPSYDPHRGEGEFHNVEISPALNTTMANAGNKIYEVKCSACHKLTNEKLVGPGWEGVTKRKTPEWIMNFITNPDAMIDKDPEVQEQLDICLVRMPNQNLTGDDARNIYEFMRRNDGVK